MIQLPEANAQASSAHTNSEVSSVPATTSYNPHPATALIPPCRSEEYEALKADIAENGQKEPIVLYQGQILDGLTRYRACTELKIKPKTIDYSGSSPEDYVISRNLHRRHLTQSQLAGIAARFIGPLAEEAAERMKLGKGQDNSGGRGRKNPRPDSAEGLSQRPRDVLAKKFGVSKTLIQDALRIARNDPVLLGRVIAGEISLSQALKSVGPEKRAEPSRHEESDSPHDDSERPNKRKGSSADKGAEGERPSPADDERADAATDAEKQQPERATRDKTKKRQSAKSSGNAPKHHEQAVETRDLVSLSLTRIERLLLAFSLYKALTLRHDDEKVRKLANVWADQVMKSLRDEERATGEPNPPA
ncbi:MAG TPA: ParB/RepB/Spo0J family partition protein, partial [Fimbriimonadaceae bacterium]|nr:ParB/RepB/Spo0J family partition protein [Fimbriimonadaceae bacterium]